MLRRVQRALLAGETGRLRAFDRDDWIDASTPLAEDGFPKVPAAYRHSSAPTFEAWLAAGVEHFTSMLEILRAHGFDPDAAPRILDFGCSSGRTVRQWAAFDAPEVWGCEIDFDRVQWCKQNLGERFKFVQTRLRPPLPFEDRTFDLIYAGSVFTHISDHIDEWLLELRRTLRPGGLLFVTIHDETTWKIVNEEGSTVIGPAVARSSGQVRSELPADFIAVGRDAASQIFFRSSYFEQLCAPYFTVEEYRSKARGYQSAVLLRKPEEAGR